MRLYTQNTVLTRKSPKPRMLGVHEIKTSELFLNLRVKSQ